MQSEIERAILSGEMPTGTRLNENALAAKLGVSRGPIREACRALAELGLVRLVPNRGVFIQRMDQSDAVEIYDLRAGLVGLGGQLLACRVTAEQIAELTRQLAVMEQAVDNGDFPDFVRLNLDFHDFILRATGNARLLRSYRAVVKEFQLFRIHGLTQADALRESHREHCAIVAALVARDAAESYRVGFDHVSRGKVRMLAALEARYEPDSGQMT